MRAHGFFTTCVGYMTDRRRSPCEHFSGRRALRSRAPSEPQRAEEEAAMAPTPTLPNKPLRAWRIALGRHAADEVAGAKAQCRAAYVRAKHAGGLAMALAD